MNKPTHSEGESNRRRIAVCAILVLAVSVAHYLTSPTHFFWHNVFQRLYYIPLLLAAGWFGLRGGLLAALICAALYSPHIFLHWAHTQAYQISQVMELAMMFMLGAMAGALSDRQRLHRRRAEDLAVERDEALVNLRDTVDSLRRADRLATLGTMAAGMAHELRNPLAAMTGAVEILEKELPDHGTTTEFMSILRQEMERLNKVAGKYIDFARPQEPELKALDINESVQSAVDLLKRSAEKSRVEIRFTPDAGIPHALADAVQVHQALVNILLNGIQSMQEGGLLQVNVEADRAGIRILVRDHGPGLPPGPPERIFEPFFSTREGGTGLGLAVTRQIASSHGGRLSADGAPGGGAIFCFQLPAAGTGGAA